MQDIQLISRAGANSNLLDFGFQEELYKVLKAKGSVLETRKLREAIIASSRKDEFAISVYELSVDICASHQDYQEMFKSLGFLVKDLYLAVEPSQTNRRIEMCSLFVLFFVVSSSESKLNDVLIACQYVSRLGINPDNLPALKWYRCTVGIIDYVKMREFQCSCSPIEKELTQRSMSDLQTVILGMLVRAYFELPLEKLREWLLLAEDEDVPLCLIEQFNIQIDETRVILKTRKSK